MYLAAKGIKTRSRPPGFDFAYGIDSNKVGNNMMKVTPNPEMMAVERADKDLMALKDLYDGVEEDKKAEYKRYLVDYKRAAEHLKGIFHDGTPDVEGTDMRPAVVDGLRNEVRMELDQEMRKGNMSFQDAQKFMDEDFKGETKHFLQSSLPDREGYEREVRRRLQRHKSMYGKKSFIL